jgi:feruloyl esterase
VDRPDCLTPAQVTAVRRIYQAPHDEHGRLLYPGGLEPGSEAAWIGAVTAPPGAQPFLPVVADNWLRHLAFPAGQPGIPLGRWRFTKRLFDRLRPEAGIYHALDPDLRAFRDAGGKLILYHGWSDQLIPPRGTLNYYQAVQDRMGGLHATRRFARLFMLPDMFHCAGGGPSPNPSDLVLQLVDWVERGTAPARVLAAQTGPGGNVIRTRPVFPYPLRARYTGSGSIDDAASFVAAPPPSPPDDHIDWLGSDLLRPRARKVGP